MKISVTVKPNSRKEGIEKQDDGSYIVRANAPATEGRANERVIELLAKHFGVSKSRIDLNSGARSKKKIFSIR